MTPADPKTYLWANIEAHMGGGAQTIDAVQKRTGASRGTVQRIKGAKNSTGIDVLMEVSQAIGIEVWELLRPSTQSATLPTSGSALRSALKVLAGSLDALSEDYRVEVADRLRTLAMSPDSTKAIDAVEAALVASLAGEIPEFEQARRTGAR